MFKNFTLYAVMKDSKWLNFQGSWMIKWETEINTYCLISNMLLAEEIAKRHNGKVAIIHAEVINIISPKDK